MLKQVSVTTSTVTVNAAFLQEIKEDNSRLRQLTEEAENFVANQDLAQEKPHDFANLVDELRDQLAFHFALEEAYGYFEEPVNEAPRLSQTAIRLREEHQSLFVEICSLAEEAERLAYEERSAKGLQSMVAGLRKFQARLRQHEAEENELILSAFDEDLGVGD